MIVGPANLRMSRRQLHCGGARQACFEAHGQDKKTLCDHKPQSGSYGGCLKSNSGTSARGCYSHTWAGSHFQDCSRRAMVVTFMRRRPGRFGSICCRWPRRLSNSPDCYTGGRSDGQTQAFDNTPAARRVCYCNVRLLHECRVCAAAGPPDPTPALRTDQFRLENRALKSISFPIGTWIFLPEIALHSTADVDSRAKGKIDTYPVRADRGSTLHGPVNLRGPSCVVDPTLLVLRFRDPA